VTLETDSPGTDYDDNATTITLYRAAGTQDVFETRNAESMVLVSNAADNKLAVDGIANNAPNDRTHIVALGGTVKVKYGGREATGTVDVLKKVTVHATILTDAANAPLVGEPYWDRNMNGRRDPPTEPYRDVNGNGSYDARLGQVDARKRFDEDIKILNESYAQVGVQFTGTVQFKVAPAALLPGIVVLSRSKKYKDAAMTPTELALVRAGFNSAAPDDIEVYYVTRLINPVPGISFTPDFYVGMKTPDIYDTTIIPNNAKFYTLSHEVYHLPYTKVGHPYPEPNLFAPTTDVVRFEDTSHLDTKRLNDAQEQVIWNSKYAKKP
jgi:hypothetical protein